MKKALEKCTAIPDMTAPEEVNAHEDGETVMVPPHLEKEQLLYPEEVMSKVLSSNQRRNLLRWLANLEKAANFHKVMALAKEVFPERYPIDEDGELMDENDDGNDQNCRITHALPEGDYRFTVTGYSGATGSLTAHMDRR